MLLLLSMMILIIGFTCPSTIHFKFITKRDSLFYYKVRQDFYYKERQVLLQSATEQTVAALEIFAAHHYNMVTKIIVLFISPLNSKDNFQIFSKFYSDPTTKKIIGTFFSSVKRPHGKNIQ